MQSPSCFSFLLCVDQIMHSKFSLRECVSRFWRTEKRQQLKKMQNTLGNTLAEQIHSFCLQTHKDHPLLMKLIFLKHLDQKKKQQNLGISLALDLLETYFKQNNDHIHWLTDLFMQQKTVTAPIAPDMINSTGTPTPMPTQTKSMSSVRTRWARGCPRSIPGRAIFLLPKTVQLVFCSYLLGSSWYQKYFWVLQFSLPSLQEETWWLPKHWLRGRSFLSGKSYKCNDISRFSVSSGFHFQVNTDVSISPGHLGFWVQFPLLWHVMFPPPVSRQS